MPRARWQLASAGMLVVAAVLMQGCGTSDPNPNADEPASSPSVPKFISKAKTRESWNPNVGCSAVVTRLRRVLGHERSASGGATYRGGRFKPGIPDRRALHPPCRVRKVPTFVQLNHVVVGSCDKINDDGDWTCWLEDPRLDGPQDMRRIHIETDQKFRHRKGWSKPPGGEIIRVQGFVFWDPGHTEEDWHNHSGWEIHSFTAWRHAR